MKNEKVSTYFSINQVDHLLSRLDNVYLLFLLFSFRYWSCRKHNLNRSLSSSSLSMPGNRCLLMIVTVYSSMNTEPWFLSAITKQVCINSINFPSLSSSCRLLIAEEFLNGRTLMGTTYPRTIRLRHSCLCICKVQIYTRTHTHTYILDMSISKLSQICSWTRIFFSLWICAGQAESGLERLHQCAEKELQQFLYAKDASSEFRCFREKLSRLTRYALSYFVSLFLFFSLLYYKLCSVCSYVLLLIVELVSSYFLVFSLSLNNLTEYSCFSSKQPWNNQSFCCIDGTGWLKITLRT